MRTLTFMDNITKQLTHEISIFQEMQENVFPGLLLVWISKHFDVLLKISDIILTDNRKIL
jgi:hypothetical protein